MSDVEKALGALKYDENGLIPAVIVDSKTKAVLMVGYMNADSLRGTIRTGKTHYWSRSRKRLWMKGESSGHTQQVQAVYCDCDGDALVIEVIQRVAACHMGYMSCYFREYDAERDEFRVAEERVFDPKKVY